MITVTVLTKNNAATIQKTLESVKNFSEVLLFDTGSTDATLSIAKEHPNVRIISGDFSGFGPTHNHVSSLATYDWVLSLDSDEVLSPSLILEIHSLSLDPRSVYRIQRKNFFNGKWIRGCGGWHPDWVIRLYNRKTTRFTDDAVHEKIETDGLLILSLQSPILHTPYRHMSDFLSKMQHYSTLFAEQHSQKRPASLARALLHSWSAFLKSYFLKKGFIAGKEGLIISLYNGHTAFYKYLKLAERNTRE